MTYEKFYKAVAEAMGAEILYHGKRTAHTGHYVPDTERPYGVKDGRQVLWLQNAYGTYLANVSDLIGVGGGAEGRCYIEAVPNDNNGWDIFVYYNLIENDPYDKRGTGDGEQILIWQGKTLAAAIKKALAFDPRHDCHKYPIWK